MSTVLAVTVVVLRGCPVIGLATAAALLLAGLISAVVSLASR